MEYLTHLALFEGWPPGTQITFLVLERAKEKLKGYSDHVNFVVVPKPQGGNQLKRTWQEGTYLAGLAKEHALTHLVFMNLDPYQHVIAVRWLWPSEVKLSGILFSPPHRIEVQSQNGWWSKTLQNVRRRRKKIQLRLATSNPALKDVFVLDDKSGVNSLNQQYRNVFRMLPDPIAQNKPEGTKNFFEKRLGIPVTDKIILSFGSVIPRKNLEACIRAFAEINNPNLWFVISGKGKPEYSKKIRHLIDSLGAKTAKRVVFKNEFVDYDDIPSIFSSADLAIMVYKNFYGSSGVLGHAAMSATPVLTGNKGLIKELVETYRLGRSVEENQESIKRGIMNWLKENDDSGDYKEYLDLKTPDNFCRVISESLLKSSSQ